MISLVTDPDHLFSKSSGIYVEGTNGIPGNCTSVPHNVNQDWERPGNIELFEKDGSTGLNQLAGVKIFGGCSRVRYPAKSLAFFARKEYETSSFRYRLFPDKPSEDYEAFILRASGDDQAKTLFRDPLGQMLVKDVIDVDIQDYRPAVLYINGEYWGIHNLREKINEHYLEDNFGVNPDSVDMVKGDPTNSRKVVAGNADHYNAMIDYLKTNDITQEVHYDYMKTRMDMNEYMNYMIIQIFFAARDWPGSNIKFWRSRESPHNRWRWAIFDMDHVFKDHTLNVMELATEPDCSCTWPNPPWSTYLLRTLLRNDSFKQEFVQRFSIYASSHFSKERIHRHINEMQAVLAPEIPRHIDRWGGQRVDLPDQTFMSPVFNSVEMWEENVQKMRYFTDARHEIAMAQMLDYCDIENLSDLRITVDPAGKGLIKIGNTAVDIGGLYLSDSLADRNKNRIPSHSPQLTTIPPDGYLILYADNNRERGALHLNFKLRREGEFIQFIHYDESTVIDSLTYTGQFKNSSSSRIGVSGDWCAIPPTPGAENRIPDFSNLVINEVMGFNITFYPDEQNEYDDWIELYNSGESPIDIGGLFITDSLGNPFRTRISSEYPDSTSIAPRDYLVLWADNSEDQGIYHLGFKISKTGETICLLDYSAALIDSMSYPFIGPNLSWGRASDAAPNWKKFHTPTPSRSNTSTRAEQVSENPGSLRVYPNPVSDRAKLEISSGEAGNIKIEIIGADGKMVSNWSVYHTGAGAETFMWNLTDASGQKLTNGLYYCRILKRKEIFVTKIMVQF